MSHLAEEVSLLLPRGEAGQVAADHQVGVVQNRVEPTPGGQQSLDAQDNMFIVQPFILSQGNTDWTKQSTSFLGLKIKNKIKK